MSDALPLVMEVCSLEEKPKPGNPLYTYVHDLIYNERRKRDREEKRRAQQAVADVEDQIAQNPDQDYEDLGAAEQLQVAYGEPVEGAEPIQDLARDTFDLPRQLREKDERIAELEAENNSLRLQIEV